jgi:hypothetical protein
MSDEARGWEHGPTVAFFFEAGIRRILELRFEIFDWRIEQLEMTDEARGWAHRPTVAFFFETGISSPLDFRFEIFDWRIE